MPNGTGWRSADNSVPSRLATEVDCLIKVQVIDFADCIPSAGTKAKTKNQKLTNVFRLPAFMPTCLLCVRFIISHYFPINTLYSGGI
jgi:hypothetical protein